MTHSEQDLPEALREQLQEDKLTKNPDFEEKTDLGNNGILKGVFIFKQDITDSVIEVVPEDATSIDQVQEVNVTEEVVVRYQYTYIRKPKTKESLPLSLRCCNNCGSHQLVKFSAGDHKHSIATEQIRLLTKIAEKSNLYYGFSCCHSSDSPDKEHLTTLNHTCKYWKPEQEHMKNGEWKGK